VDERNGSTVDDEFYCACNFNDCECSDLVERDGDTCRSCNGGFHLVIDKSPIGCF
jgi:hypothetical protein